MLKSRCPDCATWCQLSLVALLSRVSGPEWGFPSAGRCQCQAGVCSLLPISPDRWEVFDCDRHAAALLSCLCGRCVGGRDGRPVCQERNCFCQEVCAGEWPAYAGDGETCAGCVPFSQCISSRSLSWLFLGVCAVARIAERWLCSPRPPRMLLKHAGHLQIPWPLHFRPGQHLQDQG